MPAWANARKRLAAQQMLTPPASAASHSPERIARAAISTATSELEQAVSTVTLGPRKSNTNDTRFERIALDVPVEP
ncbi:putative polyketide synthase [Burkholderia gladioli]|uniref:Polyketide synthase n=1 Tax=Burkholderia gladioli TaxID=28095 RepID=A0AAW3EVW4_BURGA|nr:putative polyketide synthase [Burkholderia gladioli]SQA90639.1 Uncharacterised protein [Burkholderia gladioli]